MNDWNKVYFSYQKYGCLIEQFARLIKSIHLLQEIPCDVIYAIPRGGLPVATHISHSLDLEIITELPAFYTKFPFRHILVVDDIIDTGRVMSSEIKPMDTFKIRYTTASLFYKPRSVYKPDIYTIKAKNDDWIVFPWEEKDETPNRIV